MLIHTSEKKSILRAKLYVEYLYNYISKSNTFSYIALITGVLHYKWVKCLSLGRRKKARACDNWYNSSTAYGFSPLVAIRVANSFQR